LCNDDAEQVLGLCEIRPSGDQVPAERLSLGQPALVAAPFRQLQRISHVHEARPIEYSPKPITQAARRDQELT
jgi:hypothetical protein